MDSHKLCKLEVIYEVRFSIFKNKLIQSKFLKFVFQNNMKVCIEKLS